MSKDRSVRLSDLFWGVLSYWKLIIVFIVIGAICGAGFSLMNSGNTQKTKSDDTMTVGESDKAVIALYVKYSSLYQNQLDYIDSDSLMQIDPANTYRCSMTYYLDCRDAEMVDGLLAAYDSRLAELSDLYGKPNSFSIKKNQSINLTDENGNLISGGDTNCVISIIVYGTSATDCNTMLDEADQFIFEKKSAIEETFGQHTITSFRGELSKAPATVIIARQKDAIDTLNELSSSMTSITRYLDENYIAMLKYCVENHPEYENKDNIPDKISLSEDDSSSKTSKSKGISIKMVAIGAVIGFLLAFILLAIIYSIRGTLVPEDDPEELFGIPFLAAASQCAKKKKKGIDRAIDRKRRRRLPEVAAEDEAELTASNIKVACYGKNINQVYVTGTKISEREKTFLEQVAARLKTDGIELITGRSILLFPDSLERSAETGNVVLIETIGVSRYDDISAELRKCRDHNINILGIVAAG